MEFQFTVIGDRGIALKFERIPETIHDRLTKTIRDLTLRLEAAIETQEPQNTGRLRTRTKPFFTDKEQLIRGVVRVTGNRAEKLKALALEFGAHGTATVKAYTRGSDVAVSQYQRHVQVAEHRFLRGPFDAMQAEIETAIKRAFDSAIVDA